MCCFCDLRLLSGIPGYARRIHVGGIAFFCEVVLLLEF